MGITVVVSRLARVLPGTIAAGLQLGLGLSLAALGIHLIEKQLWLGVSMGAFVLVLMRYPRMPVALVAVVAGIIVGQLLGIAPPMPVLDFGWHLPHLVIPSWAQIVHGTQNAVLPQIPLTLTNAIIVTAAVSRQLFPKELHPVNERNLAITTGLGNLLSAPFGGYLMCHGAGGDCRACPVRRTHRNRSGFDRACLCRSRHRFRLKRLCAASDNSRRRVRRASDVFRS